jgi:Major tropism determinant N-terminal domain
MASKIQFRRDTSTNWTNTNPVLAQGEPGLETDTGKVKYGNGSDNWTSLSYSSLSIGDNGQVIIGNGAGSGGTGQNAIAIGTDAGVNQQFVAIAIGHAAGSNNQGGQAIAVGRSAGNNNQGWNAIAIGRYSGNQDQQDETIAIGRYAGRTNQRYHSIAIGAQAGESDQYWDAIAIGRSAGNNGQDHQTIAIGQRAGQDYQASQAIAIGAYAGNDTQGQNAIAIGAYAGYNSQDNNSIVINATGDTLDSDDIGTFVVKPVRSTYDMTGFTPLGYNATTGEIAASGQGSILATNTVTGGEGYVYGRATAISWNPTNDTNLTPGAYDFTLGLNGGLSLHAEVAEGGDITLSITNGGSGHTVTNTGVINGTVLGGATPADDVTVTIEAVADITDLTALDLTKSINKLNEGFYSLADGTEGQIMYMVPRNGINNAGNVQVYVANARNSSSNGTNWLLFPLAQNNSSICTLIFTDGAWEQTGGYWD